MASSSPTLRFIKSANPHLTPNDPDTPPSAARNSFRPLVAIANIAGYSAVFLASADPSFVIKTSKSVPKVHRLAGLGVRSLSPFHSAGADRGFVYIDTSGVVRVALMPVEFNFDGNWAARKISLGEHVQSLAYFPPLSVYVISASKRLPFDLAEEDGSVAKDGIFFSFFLSSLASFIWNVTN